VDILSRRLCTFNIVEVVSSAIGDRDDIEDFIALELAVGTSDDRRVRVEYGDKNKLRVP
jgi:hypothetical protein